MDPPSPLGTFRNKNVNFMARHHGHQNFTSFIHLRNIPKQKQFFYCFPMFTILWPQRGCNILMISPYFLSCLDSLAFGTFFMFSFHVSCVSFTWVFVLQSAPHWSHWDADHLAPFLNDASDEEKPGKLLNTDLIFSPLQVLARAFLCVKQKARN